MDLSSPGQNSRQSVRLQFPQSQTVASGGRVDWSDRTLQAFIWSVLPSSTEIKYLWFVQAETRLKDAVRGSVSPKEDHPRQLGIKPAWVNSAVIMTDARLKKALKGGGKRWFPGFGLLILAVSLWALPLPYKSTKTQHHRQSFIKEATLQTIYNV
jgi:hypothetical protein